MLPVFSKMSRRNTIMLKPLQHFLTEKEDKISFKSSACILQKRLMGLRLFEKKINTLMKSRFTMWLLPKFIICLKNCFLIEQ